jgi:hypothetical protein
METPRMGAHTTIYENRNFKEITWSHPTFRTDPHRPERRIALRDQPHVVLSMSSRFGFRIQSTLQEQGIFRDHPQLRDLHHHLLSLGGVTSEEGDQ